VAIFTYPLPNISSFEAVYNCLIDQGITDAVINLNGDLEIITSIGNQATVDTAVSNAAPNTLQSNKSAMIEAISLKSNQLASKGLTVTINTITGSFPLGQGRYDFSYYQSLVFAADRTPAHLPFTLQTLQGGAMQLLTLADVEILADAATNRLRYIYLEQTNADSSKGEIGYIIDIKTAPNQTALDAIVDTRT